LAVQKHQKEAVHDATSPKRERNLQKDLNGFRQLVVPPSTALANLAELQLRAKMPKSILSEFL
jgi:hypothetical protein